MTYTKQSKITEVLLWIAVGFILLPLVCLIYVEAMNCKNFDAVFKMQMVSLSIGFLFLLAAVFISNRYKVFITALEASIIAADEGQPAQPKPKNEVSAIQSAIESAMYAGKYHIELNYIPRLETVQLLEKNGYEVAQLSTTDFGISWETPSKI